MTAIEIKNKLHQMIDDLEEQQVLNVYDYVHTQYVEDVDPIDELNEAQQTRLHESIQQAKNGQVISDEAFKQRLAEKLTNEDATLTHFASEKVLAKDWSSPIEDEVWQDL